MAVKNNGRSPKVLTAMSGGVDSSVAAALLKKQGFDVIGVFMKFWLARRSLPKGDEGGSGYNRCCSADSEQRARLVASKLGIPFYVLNFEKEFKKRIVDYFLKEYEAGLTPNPCVVCNKEIKFGLLLEKALALDADYIATGHYARIRKFVNSKQIRYSLISAEDKEKDQSYFLWQLDQKRLKHILFPVGDYTKAQVRNLAKKFDLPVLGIPESQEICFVPTTINDFLAKHIRQKSGSIACLLPGSKHPGEHRGLAFYTIGQRKGIGLPGGPFWVLDKDLKKNILIVTKNEKDLLKKELFFKNESWIAGKEPRLRQGFGGQAKFPLKVKAKIRYRHSAESATLVSAKRLIFDKPQRAITPGQSVVFYLPAEARRAKEGRDFELLGGATIDKSK